MKPFINQQTLLKGGLFLALAANLSWNEKIQSMNLSSEMKSATSTATVVQSSGQISTGQISTPTPPATAVSVSDEGPQPDAPETVSSTPRTPPKPEMPIVCGQRFYITYHEIHLNDDTITEISVKPQAGHIDGFKPILFRANGGFDVNIDQKDIKQTNDDKIISRIKDSFNHCDGDGSEVTDAVKKRHSNVADKSDRESIQQGMSECRLNSKGDPLTEVKQTRCELDKLMDLDNETDPKDSRAKQKALSKVDKIVGILKKSIKNRLLSKDEAKVDEAGELLDQTKNAVRDIARDLDLDSYRAQHMVGELDALKTGGDTYRKSLDLEDQVKDLKATMKDQLNQAVTDLRANPRDVMAGQRLLSLEREMMIKEQSLRSKAQVEITNSSYRTLTAADSLGYISSGDYAQFTQPYNALQTDLNSMLDLKSMLGGGSPDFSATLGATATFGPNFVADRNGYATEFKDAYGVSVPQRPSTTITGVNATVQPSMVSQVAPYATFTSINGAPNAPGLAAQPTGLVLSAPTALNSVSGRRMQ